MVRIECSFVYQGIAWEDVNAYHEKNKKECLMDPDRVKVRRSCGALVL